MSRTTNLAELCALLVDETYGELASRIFTILLRRGRLTIPTLIQYTRLPSRHLRHGLAVLLQQNLAYFHYDSESKTTHYEANPDAAYFLLRSGKILELIRSRLGNTARDLVQILLFLGHANIGQLVQTYESRRESINAHLNENGTEKLLVNGLQNGSKDHAEAIAAGHVQDVIVRLLEAGFLQPVVPRMFQSPSDTHEQVEKEILRERFQSGLKGTKQKEELRQKIANRLQEIRSEGEEWQRKGAKRALNGNHYDGSEKRLKVTNGDRAPNGGSYVRFLDSGFDHDLIVRVNHEKCTVALRTQQLVSVAARDISHTTSLVYAELLRILEKHIPRCRLDPLIDGSEEDPNEDTDEVDEAAVVSATDVLKHLHRSIRLSTGIGKVKNGKVEPNTPDGLQKKRKRTLDDLEAEVGGDASSDEDEEHYGTASDVDVNGNIKEMDHDSDSHGEDPFEDRRTKAPALQPLLRTTKVTFAEPKPASREDWQNRMAEVRKHLGLLAEHSRNFIRPLGGRGSAEWTVSFRSIIESMREAELDTIIYQNFGRVGLRIGQILRQKGKLEERRIQGLGLLRAKDVKSTLIEMQLAGFVDVQEIPKGNTRTYQQTIYLWFFDVKRVQQMILDRVYKTMSRCFQALKAEKQNHLEVLSMAERTDVKGQEEELLSEVRLEELRKIRAQEEEILTQISRLDELIGIFRDF